VSEAVEKVAGTILDLELSGSDTAALDWTASAHEVVGLLRWTFGDGKGPTLHGIEVAAAPDVRATFHEGGMVEVTDGNGHGTTLHAPAMTDAILGATDATYGPVLHRDPAPRW
jgi:hypothetical protein